MKDVFRIPVETETKLWNKYMSNKYELLGNMEQTVQDAGLYQGQVSKTKQIQQVDLFSDGDCVHFSFFF